jgi:hypothetical protein
LCPKSPANFKFLRKYIENIGNIKFSSAEELCFLSGGYKKRWNIIEKIILTIFIVFFQDLIDMEKGSSWNRHQP